MPHFCAVVGCSNKSSKTQNIGYFRIPAAVKIGSDPKKELAKRRREKWIQALKRKDLKETTLKYARICSLHFLNGKPADLEDINNPDWVPTIHMERKPHYRSRHTQEFSFHPHSSGTQDFSFQPYSRIIQESHPMAGQNESLSESFPSSLGPDVLTTSKERLKEEPNDQSTSMQRDDEFDLIGKLYANKLRRLEKDQRIYAERIIDDVFFEASLGNLDRNCQLTLGFEELDVKTEIEEDEVQSSSLVLEHKNGVAGSSSQMNVKVEIDEVQSSSFSDNF